MSWGHTPMGPSDASQSVFVMLVLFAIAFIVLGFILGEAAR